MLIDLDELKHWMQRIYHLDLENEITKAFFECNKKKVRSESNRDLTSRQIKFTLDPWTSRKHLGYNRIIGIFKPFIIIKFTPDPWPSRIPVVTCKSAIECPVISQVFSRGPAMRRGTQITYIFKMPVPKSYLFNKLSEASERLYNLVPATYYNGILRIEKLLKQQFDSF